MPKSEDRRNRFEREVDAGLDWMEGEARKGYPEFRRDALYAPFLIPGGAWDAEGALDLRLRRAKDRGAARPIPTVPIYVYARPPVWTVAPSDWVLEVALWMELRRERSALERWATIAPAGKVGRIAAAAATSADAMVTALGVEVLAPPKGDPVVTRIDARAGLAN